MAGDIICPEALSRAASELSNVETILSEFQTSLSERIVHKLDLTSDDVAAVQNIDLAQQTVRCVTHFLMQLSGRAGISQELAPADIAARLAGVPAEESADESYLF